MSNQTSRVIKLIATLTIGNGNQASNVILAEAFAHFNDIMIFGPATLPETVDLQLSAEDKAAASYVDADFRTAQSPPGTDVVINAGCCTSTDRPTGYALRVYAGGAVAADRVFQVLGRVPMSH